MDRGKVPELRLIIDITDFLNRSIPCGVGIQFLWYLSLCLLQFVEKSWRNGQEIAAGEFQNLASVTEGRTWD